MNLMRGVRSACEAAWRRTRVANILTRGRMLCESTGNVNVDVDLGCVVDWSIGRVVRGWSSVINRQLSIARVGLVGTSACSVSQRDSKNLRVLIALRVLGREAMEAGTWRLLKKKESQRKVPQPKKRHG
jgi:hypothetical protein